jgi:hypothetical protein
MTYPRQYIRYHVPWSYPQWYRYLQRENRKKRNARKRRRGWA